MSVFRWLCPGLALELPDWIWPRLGLLAPEPGPAPHVDHRRAALLDGRDWFGPEQQENR